MSIPTKPPDRRGVFFETLFGGGDQDRVLALIADGFPVILDHVAELLTDVECLVERKRFARARFLIATADEELGKCHVLLDCARLDVKEHTSDLKKLSSAFYDHIDKFAYMRLWRFGEFKSLWWWSMDEALKSFNIERVRFWKATSASFDEPPDELDMPHETYLDREMNLYADVSETGNWWVSPPSHGWEWFDKTVFLDRRDKTKAHLMAFDTLRKNGALTKQALQVMNAVWCRNYVNRAAQSEDLNALRHKTAEALAKVCALRAEDLMASPLCFWPCYYALQTRREDL